MIEESKYCSKVMKKHFNEKLVMTIEDNENFKNSSKCWICDNDYIDNDVISIDIIVILLEKIEALHIEIVISILNHTNSVVFHNLKNYHSHLFMQELGKFNLKINVMPNGLENI